MAEVPVDILLKARAITREAFEITQRELRDLDGAVDKVGKSSQGMTGGLGAAQGALSVLGPAIAALGVGKLAMDFINLGGAVSDGAAKLGVTTTEYQRFKYAVEQTGGSAGNLGTAITTLNKKLAGGDQSTVDALSRAGLSFAQIRAMEPGQAFEAVADAVGDIPDPMTRSRVAMELLGKGGAELLPAMISGFKELGDKAERTGQVLDENAVKQMDALGDSIDTALGAGKNLIGLVLVPLAPILREIADTASDVGGGLQRVFAGDFKGVYNDLVLWKSGMSDVVREAKEFEDGLVEIDKKIGVISKGVREKLIGEAGAAPAFDFKELEAAADKLTGTIKKGWDDSQRAATAAMAKIKASQDSLTGSASLKAATEYANSIREIGGISELSVPGIKKVAAALKEIEDSGKPVPPELRKLATEIGQVEFRTREVLRPSQEFVAIIQQWGVNLPKATSTTNALDFALQRLNKDGLIPTGRSFVDLFDQMGKAPTKTEGVTFGANAIREALIPAGRATIDWTAHLDGLTGSLDALAGSGGPLSGAAGMVADFTATLATAISQWPALGSAAKTAFKGTMLDADGNTIEAKAGDRVAAIMQIGAAVVSTMAQIDAAVARAQGKGGGAQAMSIIQGAFAGASTGGAIGGPFGAFIGGAAGMIYAYWQTQQDDVDQTMIRIADDIRDSFNANISENLLTRIRGDVDRFSKAAAEAASKLFPGGKSGFGDLFARQAAEAWNLDALIADVGGINDLNFDQFTGSFQQALDLLADGVLKADEVDDVFRRAFPAMAQYIAGSGELATAEWERFIERAGELSQKIAEVTNFVLERSGSLAGAVVDMLGPLSEEYGSLNEDISSAQEKLGAAQDRLTSDLADNVTRARSTFRDAQAEYVAAQGALNAFDAKGGSGKEWEEDRADLLDNLTEAMGRYEQAQRRARDAEEAYGEAAEGVSAAQRELNDLLGKQSDGARDAADDLQRMGVLALAAFNASRQQGGSLLESLRAIGPALNEIKELQENLPGLDTQNNAALTYLLYYNDLIEKSPELVKAAESINVATVALSQMGALGADELRALGGQGMDIFNQMTAAGWQSNEALSVMQDFLRNARQRYEELGFPIDENTQRLLDMADAAGIDTEPIQTMDDAVKSLGTGIASMTNILREGLGALIEMAGGTLPESFKEAEQAARDIKGAASDIEEGAGDAEDGMVDAGQAGKEAFENARDAANDVEEAVVKVWSRTNDWQSLLDESDFASPFDDGADAVDRMREAIDDLARSMDRLPSGAAGPVPTGSRDFGTTGSPFSQAQARYISARPNQPILVQANVMLERRQLGQAVFEILPGQLQARGLL